MALVQLFWLALCVGGICAFSPRGGTGGGIEVGRVCLCFEWRGGTGGGVKGGTVRKTFKF